MKALLSSLLLLLITGCQSKPTEAVPMPDASTQQPQRQTASPGATVAAASAAVSAPSAPSTSAAPSGPFTTPSGLRYQILTSGPAGGRSPTRNDSVVVHYRGTLTDGTVFDSSVDRGEPATFGVGQVIPGWTEALQLMKPGDEWMLYIPSYLAYGPRAVGGKIPPNSDLIFQVRLLQVGAN
ncbi:MAG TPA: FKBP-type peptidyl-prolyl cis-trans isomerase [Prosthecobacter sp.]|nr:FKBP-type peptidyl-prolyl cis-trans isomerase [Prosthecobacter sp.]